MNCLKITVLYFAFVLLSCNQAGKESKDTVGSMEMSDSTSGIISSSAAVETGKDTGRKFIRTAELKFKVKSVIQSTYDIEDLTRQQEGFVIYTNLASNTDNIINTPVSEDSSLETTYYTVSNSIILRVPNSRLDSTLKEIAQNIDYLDFRVIKAEDVALQILSNNMTDNRNIRSGARLISAIENRGKKLNETVYAEETLVNKNERSDNARISNLSLLDQVRFSTVNLTIYQRQAIKRELVSNYRNIDAYEPGFGSKFLGALKYGLKVLEAIMIFLTKMWELILFGMVVYAVYRYQKK